MAPWICVISDPTDQQDDFGESNPFRHFSMLACPRHNAPSSGGVRPRRSSRNLVFTKPVFFVHVRRRSPRTPSSINCDRVQHRRETTPTANEQQEHSYGKLAGPLAALAVRRACAGGTTRNHPCCYHDGSTPERRHFFTCCCEEWLSPFACNTPRRGGQRKREDLADSSSLEKCSSYRK